MVHEIGIFVQASNVINLKCKMSSAFQLREFYFTLWRTLTCYTDAYYICSIQCKMCLSRPYYLSYKIFAMKHENASVFISKLTLSGSCSFIASLPKYPVAIIARDNSISRTDFNWIPGYYAIVCNKLCSFPSS